MIFQREKKTLGEKMQASEDADTHAFDLWNFLREKFGDENVNLFLMFVIVLMVSYLVGNGEAAGQKKFLLLKGPTDHVLIRAYSDLMIFALVDKDKKLVSHELLLMRASAIDKIELLTEKIGPLEVEPYITTDTKETNSSVPQTHKKSSSMIEKDITQKVQP